VLVVLIDVRPREEKRKPSTGTVGIAVKNRNRVAIHTNEDVDAAVILFLKGFP
jgi:hypothetical protein